MGSLTGANRSLSKAALATDVFETGVTKCMDESCCSCNSAAGIPTITCRVDSDQLYPARMPPAALALSTYLWGFTCFELDMCQNEVPFFAANSKTVTEQSLKGEKRHLILRHHQLCT